MKVASALCEEFELEDWDSFLELSREDLKMSDTVRLVPLFPLWCLTDLIIGRSCSIPTRLLMN